MASLEPAGLETEVAGAWAEALGCGTDLPGGPGARLVPGGARLASRRIVYLASIGTTVYVCCPDDLRSRAADILAQTPADALFTARTCAAIAGLTERDLIARLPGGHA